MAIKKLDGTFNCALCDKPRKRLDTYTLCSGHMEIYYSLAPINHSQEDENKFQEMNRQIGENLEK